MDIEKAKKILENSDEYVESEDVSNAIERVLSMIGTVEWLIEEYTHTIDVIEEDLREAPGVSVGNAYKLSKKGVYGKVVEDLKEMLSEDGE